MLGRQHPTRFVIDRHRGKPGLPRLPVDEDDGDALLAQVHKPLHCLAPRREQDALQPLLLELLQVAPLALGVLRAISHEHGEPRQVRAGFDAAPQVGKEGVGEVEHDQPDTARFAGAQLPRGVVAYEAEIPDGGFDTFNGRRRDFLRMIEHVRNSADRHSRSFRNIPHTRRHACFPTFLYQRPCSTAGILEAFTRRVPDYFFDLTLIQTACQATSKLETIQHNARCSEAKEELMSMRKSPDLSDEPAPILQLRDIRKTFGSVVALRSGSLSVDRGSIHALIGENGAGKSTLVKIVAGLYQRDSGDLDRKSTRLNSSHV